MKKNIVIFVAFIIGLGAGFLIKGYDMQSHDMDSSVKQADHMHMTVEVNKSKPIPEVKVEAIRDVKDGYNIKVETKNFTISPESVNQKNEDNKGHAHIFINEVKLGRLYGSWYHISSNMLKSGQNIIEVTLNANDHSELVFNGEHISSKIDVSK